MKPAPADAAETDAPSLAARLVPQINEACGGRLQNIVWFRTDWQRGGAATARAMLASDGRAPQPVVIKLPVVQREYVRTRRMQNSDDADPIVPRLLAGDETLGGYDLAWLVIECLPHGPLGMKWHDNHVGRIAEAAARFSQAAAAFPVDRDPRIEDWDSLVTQSIAALRENSVADISRWSRAIKLLRSRLSDLVAEWRARPVTEWLHGDLHIANAMSRHSMEHGPVTLIDLAEVRPGHWIEDAVYLERLLWASPQRMAGQKPVKAIAEARKRLGIPVESNYPRLAMIRRALLTATAGRFLKSEGSPPYLAACLDRLETALHELK